MLGVDPDSASAEIRQVCSERVRSGRAEVDGVNRDVGDPLRVLRSLAKNESTLAAKSDAEWTTRSTLPPAESWLRIRGLRQHPRLPLHPTPSGMPAESGGPIDICRVVYIPEEPRTYQYSVFFQSRSPSPFS